MNPHDWSLILYTTFLQAAVGVFIVGRLLVFRSAEQAVRTRYLWTVGILGVMAVLASFTHMGSPLLAYLSMSNMGVSWLSREIFGTVLFGAAWLVSLLLEQKRWGTKVARDGWHALAGVVGLFTVYAMSMAYRTTVVPSWTHYTTTLSFFTTAGLIGAVGVMAGELLRGRKDQPIIGLTALSAGALVLMGLQTVTIAAHLVYLGAAGPQAQATAALLAGPWQPLVWLRVALLVIGGGVLTAWTWGGWLMKKGPAALLPIGGTAAGLACLAELLGRVLFFATRVKIGL